MQVKIISIGNEVLNGFTINTNAAYIAQELIKYGFEICSHEVLPDGTNILPDKLSAAIQPYSINICTGGLGPTTDDNTIEVISKIFDSPLEKDLAIEKSLHQRYGNNIPSVNKQAIVPSKAYTLINEVGTAPGLIFTIDNNDIKNQSHIPAKIIIFLPGVPQEMQHLLHNQVIPYLIARNHKTTEQIKYRKIINFYQTKEVDIDNFLQQQNLPQDISYGLYPNLSLVTLHLSKTTKNETTFNHEIEPIVKKLQQQFNTNIFIENSIEEAVLNKLKHKNKTLSLAESCTGGAIAASITKISGASQVFYGSAVVYDNSAKQNLLQVKLATLKQYGAVSQETVAEMLQGTLRTFNTDYAIAVSGIAGPNGGSTEKPIGTVFIGISSQFKAPVIKRFHFTGNRGMIITRTVHNALAELISYLC